MIYIAMRNKKKNKVDLAEAVHTITLIRDIAFVVEK